MGLCCGQQAVDRSKLMGPPGPQLQRQWMQLLLRHAERAGNQGEIPVAAVVLDERGRCIGWGSNRREQHSDPLGHAELVALGQADIIAQYEERIAALEQQQADYELQLHQAQEKADGRPHADPQKEARLLKSSPRLKHKTRL